MFLASLILRVNALSLVMLPAALPVPLAISLLITRERPSADCTTNGDGDIYGIGVRIGLYLQWASTFILRNLGSWERISQVRQATNCLCGALALAAGINVIEGSALSIDYLLSYYLTIVLFYSESYNLVREWGRDADLDANQNADQNADRDDDYELSAMVYRLHADWALIFQNILFASYTLFGAWFWQKGYLATRPAACEEKAAIIFIFSFHAAKWRTVATVLASLIGCILSIILLLHLRTLKKGIISGPELGLVRTLNTLSGFPAEMLLVHLLRPKFLVNMDQSVYGSFKSWRRIPAFLLHLFHYFIIYFAGPTVAIVSAERIILENQLKTTGITHSTGQMISLLTGTISFSLALWELGMKLRRDKD